jgi:histidinol dehydrogenase
MLPIYDADPARKTILKRIPPDEMIVPEAILDGIEKTFGQRINPSEAVRLILKDVRTRGDAALKEWTQRLDGAAPETIRVSPPQLRAALDSLPEEQQCALKEMSARIEAFHRKQPITSWVTNDLGGTMGQLIRPIKRVGLYVPGGTAPLPSSVLMSAIPARVAGVSQIIIASPPQYKTGQIAPIILAAAAVAQVEEVFIMGGAQAIAAMAFGTESLAPVDKIFGPGNLFVTLAKQQVFGSVGVDGLSGPTETLVIADETARPDWVAADLLAQAEHDILASAILVTPSHPLAKAVQIEIAHQIESLSRSDIIAASLLNRGGAIITQDLDQAVELANQYAPEHLCLAVHDPWRLAEKISAAGGIFLGEYSFEVLGDYIAGPSHVMPTGGSARFASPLNLWDFVHVVSLIALDPQTADKIAPTAISVARLEMLDAHAHAAELRQVIK